ncbi:MAG: hypothetical protein HQ541_15790 [Mariniphaga sp.]|nr:hypothetical protein [Mariniphaga sp.]
MKYQSKNNNLFLLIIILAGFIISAGIWFFEESIYSFSFLINETVGFILSTFLIILLPIGIYYFTSEKKRIRKYSGLFSMLGFFPSVSFLVFIILSNHVF